MPRTSKLKLKLDGVSGTLGGTAAGAAHARAHKNKRQVWGCIARAKQVTAARQKGSMNDPGSPEQLEHSEHSEQPAVVLLNTVVLSRRTKEVLPQQRSERAQALGEVGFVLPTEKVIMPPHVFRPAHKYLPLRTTARAVELNGVQRAQLTVRAPPPSRANAALREYEDWSAERLLKLLFKQGASVTRLVPPAMPQRRASNRPAHVRIRVEDGEGVGGEIYVQAGASWAPASWCEQAANAYAAIRCRTQNYFHMKWHLDDPLRALARSTEFGWSTFVGSKGKRLNSKYGLSKQVRVPLSLASHHPQLAARAHADTLSHATLTRHRPSDRRVRAERARRTSSTRGTSRRPRVCSACRSSTCTSPRCCAGCGRWWCPASETKRARCAPACSQMTARTTGSAARDGPR